MERPNLARAPFLDTRPVIAVSAALTVLALVLTAMSVFEVASAKGEEHSLAERLKQLEARRTELSGQVVNVDRELGHESWKRLEQETASLQRVVAQRSLAWSRLLADLEEAVPWDVRLVSIMPKVDEDGTMTVALAGIATSRSAWLRMLASFLGSKRFSDPVPGSEEAPGASNSLGYRFQLSVRYWPEGRS